MSTLLNPNQLILEISTDKARQTWNESQKAASSGSRWQTYLNRLVLDTFIEYAREEQEETVAKVENLQSINELINGIAIAVGDARVILIPSEAEDLEELRVPQEWIDVPQLAGDYYVAVQVNVDDSYLRIWGYTTHQQLKESGEYSFSDRCYSLAGADIIGDINALWVARELCPDEVTRADITVLTEITSQQADNLIQRLGNKENRLPRLTIPFTMWGALIANNAWRDRIVSQRRGKAGISILKWLKAEASDLLPDIGWRQVEFQPSTLGARGSTATPTPKTALAKQLSIDGQTYELKLIPIEENTWGFELRSLVLGGMIPTGYVLRLLTDTGANFPENEDRAITPVESLYLEVELDEGEGLIWEIEPTPEDYQARVLYF